MGRPANATPHATRPNRVACGRYMGYWGLPLARVPDPLLLLLASSTSAPPTARRRPTPDAPTCPGAAPAPPRPHGGAQRRPAPPSSRCPGPPLPRRRRTCSSTAPPAARRPTCSSAPPSTAPTVARPSRLLPRGQDANRQVAAHMMFFRFGSIVVLVL